MSGVLLEVERMWCVGIGMNTVREGRLEVCWVEEHSHYLCRMLHLGFSTVMRTGNLVRKAPG